MVPVAPGCPFRLSILSAAVEATFQGSLVVSSAIAVGRLYGIRLCPDACRCYLSLLAPPLHISTPEHFKCFVLADELWVVGIELQQVDDACGEVVEEGGVAYALVGEVEEYHLQLALLSAHWVWCFVGFITQLVDELKQPVMLAPLVEEKDGESKQQETEGLVKDKVEEEREDTVVLLLSEKEECSCASDDK